ncbi:MAG: MoxR family ATPase [Acidobacteriota bacterium]
MVGAPGGRDLSESIALLGRIRRELGHAVVGQEEVVDQVLSCLVASGHVLLEGPPGLGKTLMVLALAQSFGGRFSRVQFTPDLMPADVTGHAVLDPTTGEFRIRKGPAFTNLLLADEINRAPAKTQAALLEVMQEMQVSIEGQALPLEGPYMVLATQNPLEHEGTYPLPEAQLDRFLMKVLIEHAKEKDEELAVVRKVTTDRSAERLDVSSVDEVASAKEILDLQAAAASLTVDERNLDYAVRIVRRTRRWPGIRVGAGPRGGIALVRVARARALLESRDYVTPDDIKGSALPVLRHRILLAPELEIEGRSPDDLLASLIDDVQAPRT